MPLDSESNKRVAMKRIAVLMTCFNRVDTTLKCLRRLFTQEVPEGYSIDVWLVDDASPDKTGDKVKAAYPQVNVVHGTGGLFWCKGMRLAWDKAAEAYDYDFYLWLNDDVMFVNEGVLSSIISDANNIEGNENSQYVLVGTCASDDSLRELVYGCYGKDVLRPNGAPQLAGDKCSMSGNIVLVPKSVFKDVGPIYDRYSHACGDSDYRQMMLKKHIKLFCSSIVCGVCPKQPERYMGCRGNGLIKRVRSLFSPKGASLHDTFIYRYRHWGILRACVSVCHVVFRVVFTDWR